MTTPPNAAFQAGRSNNDDEDLEDLLTGSNDDSNSEVKVRSKSRFSKYHTHIDNQANFFCNLSSYLWLLFLTHTRISKCLSFIMLGILLYSFLSFAIRPTERIGRVSYHMSSIKSKYDLKLGEIDHWCLDVSFR